MIYQLNKKVLEMVSSDFSKELKAPIKSIKSTFY